MGKYCEVSSSVPWTTQTDPPQLVSLYFTNYQLLASLLHQTEGPQDAPLMSAVAAVRVLALHIARQQPEYVYVQYVDR